MSMGNQVNFVLAFPQERELWIFRSRSVANRMNRQLTTPRAVDMLTDNDLDDMADDGWTLTDMNGHENTEPSFEVGTRVRVRGGSMGGRPILGSVIEGPQPSCFSDTVRVKLDRQDPTSGLREQSFYTDALEVV